MGSTLLCMVTLKKSHNSRWAIKASRQTHEAFKFEKTYCSSTLSHPGCLSQTVKSVMLPLTKLILSMHLHRPIGSRAVGESRAVEQPVVVHRKRRIDRAVAQGYELEAAFTLVPLDKHCSQNNEQESAAVLRKAHFWNIFWSSCKADGRIHESLPGEKRESERRRGVMCAPSALLL